MCTEDDQDFLLAEQWCSVQRCRENMENLTLYENNG